ncbi:MAG: hypothetical protein LVQ96_04385 [Thermoplasmatales archaeon]|nr:hypothetical protein [Thermoplasmatales archaeon]MCW6170392.1 hypothetical protein [Thermoplasmatales archaeon]
MVDEENKTNTLARDSFIELRYIFNWSITNKNYRPGDTVLVGGWAVHSFNPWKYSLDIDLLATDRFKGSLKNHLYTMRGYSTEKVPLYLKVLLYKQTLHISNAAKI